MAIGGYFLTRRTQWNASVLPVYAVSGAAGLILSSALWTSRLVPRNVSILGLIGYPVFLVGSAAPVQPSCWHAPLVVVHVHLRCAEGRERPIGNGRQECLCRAGSVACLPALHAANVYRVKALWQPLERAGLECS
jgi:hypothetical protein